jgi:hypothetical protein
MEHQTDNVLPQNTAAAFSVGFFVIRSGLFGSPPSGSFYIGIDVQQPDLARLLAPPLRPIHQDDKCVHIIHRNMMITRVIPNFIRFGKGNMEGRSQECLHHCAFGYVLTSYNLHRG